MEVVRNMFLKTQQQKAEVNESLLKNSNSNLIDRTKSEKNNFKLRKNEVKFNDNNNNDDDNDKNNNNNNNNNNNQEPQQERKWRQSLRKFKTNEEITKHYKKPQSTSTTTNTNESAENSSDSSTPPSPASTSKEHIGHNPFSENVKI